MSEWIKFDLPKENQIKTVKQVLWVSSDVTKCIQAYWHIEGLNPNSDIPGRPAKWHKVPTLTREVEI